MKPAIDARDRRSELIEELVADDTGVEIDVDRLSGSEKTTPGQANDDQAEKLKEETASPAPSWRERTGRKTKIGGVAPFVKPPGRFEQWKASRHWGRKGFVPLSPGREKRRHRILPRTVIGISTMLMCVGIGAAFAGAGFYAFYDNRLAENERQVSRFVDGFDEQFNDASTALDDLRVDAVDQIRDELAPLGEYTTDATGVIELPAVAGPSVWSVETKDQAGRDIVGSAFAITGHNGGTALVTSLAVVRASTAQPSPTIEVVKDGERVPAVLWAWDTKHDLALLLVEIEIPLLDMASGSEQADSLGGRIFALSGIGGQGATASPGVLLDISTSGLQHTASIGTFFEGGPLLNGGGEIIGVAIGDYQPNGIDSGDVGQAPDVTAICSRLLRCADTADSITIEVADEGD